jgi:hypothetical protein
MPPLAIAAGIGAAATIGGAVLSSKAQKSAAKKAAAAATDNTAANNALARELYAKNSANLSPFMNNGLAASNALNGMLLGTPQASAPAQVQGSALYGMGTPASSMGGAMPEGFYPWDQSGNYGRTAEEVWAEQNGALAPQTLSAPVPQGAIQAQNPWDQFRNSTNYQFRFNEGMKGLNQNYAARGLLESGAAMKGINNYAQNFASNELGNYMALLSNQQNMGMSGASALAGVGQNMVNNITANNNSGASAVANAALVNGTAQGQMYGQIAGAVGNLAGSLGGFGSSYGGKGGIGGGATALPYGGTLPAWRI